MSLQNISEMFWHNLTVNRVLDIFTGKGSKDSLVTLNSFLIFKKLYLPTTHVVRGKVMFIYFFCSSVHRAGPKTAGGGGGGSGGSGRSAT